MRPTTWAPCQAHDYHTRVYPLSPHKSLFFFLFFFSSLSPNIQTHGTNPSLPLHSLPFTESKQRRSPPHRVQIALISSKRNPPSVDLHRHPTCKITSDGQQRCWSPPSWPSDVDQECRKGHARPIPSLFSAPFLSFISYFWVLFVFGEEIFRFIV